MPQVPVENERICVALRPKPSVAVTCALHEPVWSGVRVGFVVPLSLLALEAGRDSRVHAVVIDPLPPHAAF